MKQPTLESIRYWQFIRQGLDAPLQDRAPDSILASTGWARSVGGSAPYLTLFARGSGSRETVDAAVASVHIQELPSARGCTYIVPAVDYSLALNAARQFSGQEMAVARKLGVTDAEVDRLCDRILTALRSGPLDPEGIREAVGDATRSLGEAGKKKGIGTTLPLAFERLQRSGDIRRIPVNGRLDQQRYKYALWGFRPEPMSDAQIATELARRFFRWIGPATLADFRKFSGLGVKVSSAAVDSLGLIRLESSLLLFPEDYDELLSIKLPAHPRYALVSSLDWMVTTALEGRASHPILDRGIIVGAWEFDPSGSGAIVWKADVPASPPLHQVVSRAEAWVREELGDVRSFSLDSPKARLPRIAAIREAAAVSARE